LKKVAVILTQPIENNSSSMIRCKGIISALAKIGYELTCFCPNANVESIYYGKDSDLESCVRIVRYGGNKVLNVKSKCVKDAKSINKKILTIY